MPDYGARMADKAIKTLDRKINRIYNVAKRELQKKLADFVEKHEQREKVMQQKVKDGLMTEQQYNDWHSGQVFTQRQWEKKVEQAIAVISKSNQQAVDVIHEQKIDVFVENRNYGAFQAEMTTGVSFDIYDQKTVEKLIKRNPQLLPKWKIDEEKDYTWNYKKLKNCITQGIIQGESIDKIAKRISEGLASQNENKMRMFARTGITQAQNAGRMEVMHESQKKGINVKKKWLATMDRRTRDAHRHLDGKEAEVDEPFDSDLGKIMFPGDPSASMGNVCNCRCTLQYVYPDFADLIKGDVRRAYGEYTDSNGKEHRFSYLTNDQEAYQKWKNEKISESATLRKKEETRKAEEEKVEEKPILERMQDKINSHTGDWSLDELIDLGKTFADYVDKQTAELANQLQDLRKKSDEYTTQMKELNKKRKAFTGDARKEAEDMMVSVTSERSKTHKEIERIKKEINKTCSEEFNKLYEKIRTIGGINETNLDDYADFSYYRTQIKKTRAATIEAMNRYPIEWLNSSKTGKLPLCPHWTTGRAYYQLGEIRFDGDINTGIHEMIHRFESTHKGISDYEKEFYNRRTAEEPLELLKDLLGNGYGIDEKTRKDNFVSAYMGKEPIGDHYELCSTGYAELLNNNYFYFEKDPEMRNWLIGMILTI